MRHTLEQLRAMSDEALYKHWCAGKFPFESLKSCGNCLTDHVVNRGMGVGCPDDVSHEPLVAASLGIHDWREHYMLSGELLRTYLEELYALRLFYDHLYPQPDEQQRLSGCAAITGSECGQQPATDELEQARLTHYELSTGERT